MRSVGWLLFCALAACRSGAPAPGPEPAAEAETVPAVQPEPTSQPSEAADEGAPTSQPADEGAPTSQPADDGYEATLPKIATDGSEVYGGDIAPGVEEVPLASLLAQPEKYRDKRVQTSGTVARVCKNMGCWMELRGEDPAHQIRAPMAGHAFFLPQKVVGRRATVQGDVLVRELTPEQKAHFEAEGARATDVAVSIQTTAVAVR